MRSYRPWILALLVVGLLAPIVIAWENADSSIDIDMAGDQDLDLAASRMHSLESGQRAAGPRRDLDTTGSRSQIRIEVRCRLTGMPLLARLTLGEREWMADDKGVIRAPVEKLDRGSVVADGYQAQEILLRQRGVQEIRLTPLERVRVIVVDKGGQARPKVQVLMAMRSGMGAHRSFFRRRSDGEGAPSLIGTTNPNGEVIAPGIAGATVMAMTGGEVSEPRVLRVHQERIVLTLSSGKPFIVRMRDSLTAQPVAGVSLRYVSRFERLDLVRQTGPDGATSLPDLGGVLLFPPGFRPTSTSHGSLSRSHPDYVLLGREELAGEQVRIQVEDLRRRYRSLRILDAESGQPVRHARIFQYARMVRGGHSDRWYGSEMATAFESPEGTWFLPLVGKEFGEGVLSKLTILAKGYQRRDVLAPESEVRSGYVVRLNRAARRDLRLTSGPLPYDLLIRDEGTMVPIGAIEAGNASGTFEDAGGSIGVYSQAQRLRELSRAEMGSDGEVALTLPRPGRVRVLDASREDRTRLVLVSESSRTLSATATPFALYYPVLDDKGLSFQAPPGNYALTWRGGEALFQYEGAMHSPFSISLPPGAEVEVRKPGYLHGEDSAEGQVAGLSSFESGLFVSPVSHEYRGRTPVWLSRFPIRNGRYRIRSNLLPFRRVLLSWMARDGTVWPLTIGPAGSLLAPPTWSLTVRIRGDFERYRMMIGYEVRGMPAGRMVFFDGEPNKTIRLPLLPATKTVLVISLLGLEKKIVIHPTSGLSMHKELGFARGKLTEIPTRSPVGR